MAKTKDKICWDFYFQKNYLLLPTNLSKLTYTMNKKIGLGLNIMVALLMTASAVFKLIPNEPPAEMKAYTHLLEAIKYIAALELIVIVLWVVPQTKKIGFYLLNGYLGGAIATHIIMGTPFIFPAVILALSWVAMYLQDKTVASPLNA